MRKRLAHERPRTNVLDRSQACLLTFDGYLFERYYDVRFGLLVDQQEGNILEITSCIVTAHHF